MIQNITTEKIKISNTGAGMNEALDITERTAGVMNLKTRGKLRLRLLAEEMLSMVQAVTGDFNADFWISTEDRTCTLNLEAKSELDYPKRKELLSVSTTGKNAANTGIMDKIRGIIEAGIYGMEESFALQAEYGTGMFSYGALGVDDGMAGALYAWSMQKYKNDTREDPEAWDELEKSIIANIADDVSVGILRDSVKLAVKKTFKEDE